MIGRTLGFYFARLFFRNTMLVFLLILFLIVAVDMTDQARRMSRHPDVPFSDFLLISLAKAPGFAEKILPFATLFGCISTLILLNKRMELVVARAAGVSVWQFIWPAGLSAVLLGLFSMMIYNPLSLQTAEFGKTIEARVYGDKGNTETDRTRNFWIRHSDKAADIIIHAAVARFGGQVLSGVTAYRYDKAGLLTERIDAARAKFLSAKSGKPANWHFTKASLTKTGRKPELMKKYLIETSLSADQLDQVAIQASDVSFWQLPARIKQAEEAGKIPNNFRMQFQSLLARPLFFFAMVLIAATVSLKFVRFGQNSKVVLTGILAGFVLYVITELVVGIGKNGVVSPWLAAWAPATVVAIISVTILLHQEDG